MPLLLVAVGAGCGDRSDRLDVGDRLHPDEPVRPGKPGVHPFWNAHARRFIYAPAFGFETADGDARYRMVLTSERGDSLAGWETEAPWTPLRSVWGEMGPGKYRLAAFAVSAGNEQPVGERAFIKSPAFAGLPVASFDYAEHGRRSLEALLRDPRAQTWLTDGKPNPDYPLWVHPTKIIGGLVRGMALLAAVASDEAVAREATEVARRAADFLLAMREPAGSPLAHWPPTYWDGVPRGQHPVYLGQHMTVYPAEGAEALLDLFDLTADSVYFDAALDIFQTYERLQRADGTWYLLLDAATGEPVKQNALIPTRLIRLLDRMRRQYGVNAFAAMRERAMAWCMRHPVAQFAWEAQFEDTRPKPQYRNMSHREAAELAMLLLQDADSDEPDLHLALDLMRYVEDQFVVWDARDPVLWTNFFREGSPWNGNDAATGKDWFLPSVVEQYAFFTPISGATATVVELYLTAFRRTGDARFRQRAVALAQAIVEAQIHHGGGEIPTHLRRTLPEANWINVGVNAATVLLHNADDLRVR